MILEVLGLHFSRLKTPLLVPLLATASLLSGCATLPSNGPTSGQVTRAVTQGKTGLNIDLVDISPAAMARFAPAPGPPSGGFASLDRSGESNSPDMIRPGDTLSIAIYEVGVSLFSAQSAAGGELGGQVSSPVANAQRINGVQVDEAGGVQLPYIGYISIAGMMPRTVESLIEQRLRGLSQSPRALVAITDSLEATVYLSGAIARPGRYRISIARENLRDYLTVAGGIQGDPEDAAVRLTRNGQSVEMRLDDITVGSPDDVMLLAGDQVEILRRPRTYTVFGASDKIAQMPFSANVLSLSEAIARAGGPSDARANPRGVFLFRFEPSADQGASRPVIYRLDMMNPGSYFLSQQIALRDKDLIYFSNAASGPPSKLIGIINQLFGPFVTARAIAR